MQQNVESITLPIFYNHFGYTLGSLPLYATGPFVYILGLTEFSVRLSSAVFTLASFVLLYLILRKLKVNHARIGVLIFALAPVVIHIGRINFGHAPSIFLMLLGF